MDRFLVSGIQMDVLPRAQEKNLERALGRIEEAASLGAGIVILPELFTTGFDYEYIRRVAAPFPSPATEALGKAAKDLEIHLIGGSLPEKVGERIYNTSPLWDRGGNLLGTYRKVHLFPLMEEDRNFHPGGGPKVFETELCRLGILICYDLRFPEEARDLARRGAEVLFLPSQFPDPRREHWRVLLRARAIENQVYVAAVNRVGSDGRDTFFGETSLIDPGGEVLASAGREETIVTAEIDLERVRRVREQFSTLPS
jgi:predicted amidohydrolase